MIVFLNGQFVPEDRAVVSVLDRGFLYGDGLFETMLVRQGKVFRWDQHIDRLHEGAELLRLQMPFARAALGHYAAELIRRNQMPEAVLRLTLSRGVGARGYSTRSASAPTLVMTLHEPPPAGPAPAPRWRLITSSLRVPVNDPMARVKSANKLPQILARLEAEDQGADEALLLNTDGAVTEAASSNLFWLEGETVCTPPLGAGLLAGVTRAAVIELCRSLGSALSRNEH